jgi:hypothetical protein
LSAHRRLKPWFEVALLVSNCVSATLTSSSGFFGNHDWRAMMRHDAQALLALTISAALCLGAWIWARRQLARRQLARLSRER